MGLSSSSQKETTNTQQQAVTQPTVPSYAQPALTDYYGQVANLGQQIASNPSLFAVPANDTQKSAIDAANKLGSWQSGLDTSTALATKAGNTTFAPVNAQQATTPNLGAAPTASLFNANSASILDTPIDNYLNPVTNDLVNTTLANYDQQAGQDRAAQAAAAARTGAFGGSRYGIAQSQLVNNQELGRASTEAGLRSTAFDKASQLAALDAANRQQTSLFNAGAANDNSQFNTGLAANYGLTGAQMAQNTNLFNVGAANDFSKFNAQQKQQQAANQLAAAGVIGNNSSTGGTLAEQDAAAKLAAGNAQYQIDQANALAPLTALQAYGGLIDPSLLASVTGQTVNSTGSGTSTTTQSGGLLGQLLGLGGQLGGAAILASDRRLKRGIVKIGGLSDGLGLYRYSYAWDETPRTGVMADEVARLRPWALGPRIGGFATVDYSKLEAA